LRYDEYLSDNLYFTTKREYIGTVKKRSQHPVQSPRWYGSKEVALILNTEEWRIRNFGSKLYGLEAQIKSPGSGNRKRYFFDVVLKLAVADELYSAQMNPVGIRAALDLIKAQKLVEKWVASYGESAPEMVLTLDSRVTEVEEDGEIVKRTERIWKALNCEHANAVAGSEVDTGSVAISMNLVVLWEWVVQHITELEGRQKI
jgi:hypothetical protein